MTLDPLIRRVRLGPGRDLLLADTVGFIQKLPHSVVAAFRATLEEVTQAELLLHVMDASAEDLEAREAAVEGVLREIGAGDRPCIPVLNKSDRLSPGQAARLREIRPGAVLVSALNGETAELREELVRRLALAPRSVSLRFDASDRRGIAGVYTAGRVVAHEVDGDEVRIEAEIPERLVERYREHLR
jgi:GTP-binding protein HflX